MIERKHTQAFGLISRDALFSPDMRYRYRLRIVWDVDLPTFCVIGLNPSTADEMKDDPTIRRCMGFARKFNMGGLCMLNLFALRATNPRCLLDVPDPVGPENTMPFLASEVLKCRSVPIAAWGVLCSAWIAREKEVCGLEKLDCLGFTKDYFPRHPLYLPASAERMEFPSKNTP